MLWFLLMFQSILGARIPMSKCKGKSKSNFEQVLKQDLKS